MSTPARLRFEELLGTLITVTEHRFVLAELNDRLSVLTPADLREAMAQAAVNELSPFLQNYVAAMVEHASYMKGVSAPAWTSRIAPLERPWFASTLKSLRMHLLRSSSPVAFRRRNIFIDATIGARV